METVNNTNADTIVKQLKSKGYRLSVVHWRRINKEVKHTGINGSVIKIKVPVDIPLFEARRKGLTPQLLAKGGYTTMRLTKKDRSVDISGEGKCSYSDCFCNKQGFTNALVDVLENAKRIGLTLE